MTGIEASLTLAIGAATLAAVAVGEIPRLRMNRATIAVVGATAVVALGLRPLDEAYSAIDPDTLVLLFGMMVLNANLRLAGFFDRAAESLARHAHSPRRLLALTIAISAALSALLLNDTIALGMTPLIVAMTKSAGLSPLPFLVGLATSANIGSSASLVGNPQNMIIATASGIPFLPFLAVMTPPAVAGCFFVWAVLARVYRRELVPREVELSARTRPPVDRSLLRKSLAATAVLAVLLVGGAPIALSALVAASLLLITRRHAPERVFAEIDWSLLVFFAGLFVVTDAIDAATHAAGASAAFEAWVGYGSWSLAAATALLSNLVSNVPAVLLLRGPVARLPQAEHAFFVLSAASTLAGNLTLLGSVANLIVAELARRDGVQLTFREYLKSGVVITVVTIAIAVAWLDVVARPAP
jgi:Na+/H+ antiporter NhaD/arsenite permease-like protein